MWQSQPGLIRAFTTDRQGKGKVSHGCKNHLLLFSLPVRGPHFLLQTSLNQLEVLQSRTGRDKERLTQVFATLRLLLAGGAGEAWVAGVDELGGGSSGDKTGKLRGATEKGGGRSSSRMIR